MTHKTGMIFHLIPNAYFKLFLMENKSVNSVILNLHFYYEITILCCILPQDLIMLTVRILISISHNTYL